MNDLRIGLPRINTTAMDQFGNPSVPFLGKVIIQDRCSPGTDIRGRIGSIRLTLSNSPVPTIDGEKLKLATSNAPPAWMAVTSSLTAMSIERALAGMATGPIKEDGIYRRIDHRHPNGVCMTMTCVLGGRPASRLAVSGFARGPFRRRRTVIKCK
mmetsp:Transcript_1586/g.2447  ORF Transcript_1586/g.2447 Transcript_1586/m.2447 type:complete len:155 (-) Transcript_1586:18-482(-)